MRFASSLVSSLALAACAVAVPVTTPTPEESIGGIAIGEILNLLGVGLVTNITTFITASRDYSRACSRIHSVLLA